MEKNSENLFEVWYRRVGYNNIYVKKFQTQEEALKFKHDNKKFKYFTKPINGTTPTT
jgi:hypothetical protein